MKQAVKIAVLGCGTVGAQVVRLLQERAADYQARCGASLEIIGICVHNLAAPRPDFISRDLLTDQAEPLIDQADLVIELIGGIEPARTYITRALEAGKSVVTGNKALLAQHGPELFDLSREREADLYYEAAVAGAIPVVYGLRESLAGDRVQVVQGIVNGTTNYMLDQMEKKGWSFEQALTTAQELGYAEADPTADIEGYDIQRKLMISANIAFDASLTEQQVPAAGIAGITREDIAGFNEMGYVCKLYATAKRVADGAILAVVEPTLFKAETLEAAAPANYNLITAVSEYAGRQSFFGEGAGRWPTAAAVVQDLLDLCERKQGFYTQLSQPLPSNNMCEERRYYVRYIVDTWFMDGCVEKRWGNGVLTRPVSPAQMHSWYVEARSNDPGIFFAALQG